LALANRLRPHQVNSRPSRTIDLGTHLSKAGVPLRTAQAAMRHSDPSLTANVYTDPKLLDVAGAVASLPDLPLDGVAKTA
jgi:integrase